MYLAKTINRAKSPQNGPAISNLSAPAKFNFKAPLTLTQTTCLCMSEPLIHYV